MIRKENFCVDCDQPCIGTYACSYCNIPVAYCDKCGDYADWEIDGQHYCNKCANNLADEEFESYSIADKLDALQFDYKPVD